jgi:diketogulonate reductase-like aldo/keto reductase
MILKKSQPATCSLHWLNQEAPKESPLAFPRLKPLKNIFIRYTYINRHCRYPKPIGKLLPSEINPQEPVHQIPVRIIPASGEPMPAFGLGTWSAFNVPEGPERIPISVVLEEFLAAGCRLVDTSPMYGLAEAALGETASSLKATEKLFLATKVWTKGRENGILQMENSFRLLGRKKLDLMQVHNLLDWQTHIPVLREWKAEGRIRFWGLTHYQASAFAELEKVAIQEKPDFLQFNFSIAEREAEKRLLPFAADHGIAVLINRPLGQGELFHRVKGAEIPLWAQEVGLTNWSRLFLQYVISHPAVTCAIPATRNPDHMAENLRAAEEILPGRGLRARLARYFHQL